MRISDWSSDVCSSDLTICCGAGSLGFSRGLVNTCTQPSFSQLVFSFRKSAPSLTPDTHRRHTWHFSPDAKVMPVRSEERRVGKERVSTCHSRGLTYH